MLAGTTAEHLCLLEFMEPERLDTQIARLQRAFKCELSPGDNAILRDTAAQLQRYFAGELNAFTVPLTFNGTLFQQQVWHALCAIPFGETRSYAEQARMIGRPEAVRAVARANGENRIAIIVPCHRVVGSNGSLTGYGGGLWRKKLLLHHEERYAGSALSLF